MRVRARIGAAALALTCAIGGATAHAVPATELLRRARESAGRGDWNAAARTLDDVVAAGIDSPDVLYDLGTACAQAGRYGEAVWRFEQASRRAPFDGDTQHNLRATRLLLAHRDAQHAGRAIVETATPLSVTIAELLPMDLAVALTVLCQIVVLAGVWFWRRRRSGETARVGGAIAVVLFGAGMLVAGAIVVARQTLRPSGIVLHDGLRLLEAPALDALPGGVLREGERIEQLVREGFFVRVRTNEGSTGWMHARDVGAIDAM